MCNSSSSLFCLYIGYRHHGGSLLPEPVVMARPQYPTVRKGLGICSVLLRETSKGGSLNKLGSLFPTTYMH